MRNVAVRAAGLVAGIVTAVALAGCGATISAPAHSRSVSASLTRAQAPNQTPGQAPGQTIVVNGSRPGPVFDGIGALSGGGGNSRLLIDYPEPERTQILDYMFKPHYGASLQMLKLEIGGGGFSSDGSEPSVEAVKGHLTCNVGYEFWLAHQALARNPKIKLYGLQWTAPSWARRPGRQDLEHRRRGLPHRLAAVRPEERPDDQLHRRLERALPGHRGSSGTGT